ncbi:MAG: cupin domain-containing protein [Methanobacteriota archaeon]|nr:MAG: cupin domain-containing protein [Euryarchaeota archaeon]
MKKVRQGEVDGTSPEGTKGVVFRELIAGDLGVPNFHMRLFDVAPGGNTPKHTHDWEHEVYVVEGEGKIVLETAEIPLQKGDAVFVEPNELHQFVNDGASLLRMICVVPTPDK